jgi:hypothetical protein
MNNSPSSIDNHDFQAPQKLESDVSPRLKNITNTSVQNTDEITQLQQQEHQSKTTEISHLMSQLNENTESVDKNILLHECETKLAD